MVRKNEHMFDKVNITPLGLQILTFLARNPDKQFYIREIAKKMDKSVGGTHKTLKSLKQMDFVKEKSTVPVPDHLKNFKPKGSAPYKYPHSYPGHFVKQDYTEDSIPKFYSPSEMGRAQALKERLSKHWD